MLIPVENKSFPIFGREASLSPNQTYFVIPLGVTLSTPYAGREPIVQTKKGSKIENKLSSFSLFDL